jgi:hypothetical protein
VRVPIAEAVADLQGIVDDIVEVDDTTMINAMQAAHRHVGIVLEPAGAAGIAAVLADPRRFAGTRVATVLTGGNLTPRQMREWLSSRRLVPFCHCNHILEETVMIDHVELFVADPVQSVAFYNAALSPLGYSVHVQGESNGFGADAAHLDFWLRKGGPSQPLPHVAFNCASRAAVEASHTAALGAVAATTVPRNSCPTSTRTTTRLSCATRTATISSSSVTGRSHEAGQVHLSIYPSLEMNPARRSWMTEGRRIAR